MKSFLLVSLLWIGSSAHAATVWQYQSTDGLDSFAGTLTTDGAEADAMTIGQTFNLISIDTVIYNGSDVTASSFWNASEGGGPPFTIGATGQIVTTGAGSAVIATGVDELIAFAGPGPFDGNHVALGNPNSGFETAGLLFANAPEFRSFIPTSTTFTVVSAVPEPSSIAVMGCVVVAAIGKRWRRRNASA